MVSPVLASKFFCSIGRLKISSICILPQGLRIAPRFGLLALQSVPDDGDGYVAP